MEHSQEYLKREFIHHLSDTLALLGAGEDLVNKVRQVEERPLTPDIIEEIRSFNCKWVDDVKTRLVLLNTTPVTNNV
jgi:hypothetical protein